MHSEAMRVSISIELQFLMVRGDFQMRFLDDTIMTCALRVRRGWEAARDRVSHRARRGGDKNKLPKCQITVVSSAIGASCGDWYSHACRTGSCCGTWAAPG